MTRRMTTLLAVAAAGATFGTGCTTFSDNDAVARVDDVELSSDELRARADARNAPQDEALDGNAVRQEIGVWIGEQLAAGADPDLAATSYAQGLFAAGSICFEVIIAESPGSAADGLAELQGGADFATVFAARNIDPSLTATGGRVGCFAASELDIGTGNVFVDALVELDDANRLAAVELEGNPGEPALGAVISFIPYDELGPEETPVVMANLEFDVRDVDVYVDPRYGTFDATTGAVVSLG